MLFPDESVMSENMSQNSFQQRSSKRELANNFKGLENQRNDFAEEEQIILIKPLNIQHPMSQSGPINETNLFDPRWSCQQPSILMPQQRALLNDNQFMPSVEVNEYLELPKYPVQNFNVNCKNIHQTNFSYPEDVYKFLLGSEYSFYKKSEKANIRLQYKYTGDIKEGLRHGYGKLEVVDSNNYNKVYYLCYEGLFLCGGFHGKDQIYINKATNYWYKGDYICGHEWGYGEEGDGYIDQNFKLKAYYEKGEPKNDIIKADYNNNITYSYQGDMTLEKNRKKSFDGYGKIFDQKSPFGQNRTFFKNGYFQNNKMKSGRVYVSEKINEVFYEPNSSNNNTIQNTVKPFKIKYNTNGTINSYEQY